MKLFPRSNQPFELQLGLIILWFILFFLLQFLAIGPMLSSLLDADLQEIAALQEKATTWTKDSDLAPAQLQNFVLEKAKEIKAEISTANFYYIYCSQIAYNAICFLLLGLILRKTRFEIGSNRTFFDRRSVILFFSLPFLLLTLLPLLGESLRFNEWLGIDWISNQFGLDLNESSVGNMIFTYAVFVPENTTEMLSALLFVGLIPALGEELFFRGTIQRLLIARFGNPHNAIFVTALVFSLMHFEVTAFFYRFFLGVVLGYLYYWGRSLWFPISLHALNNGLTVLSMYWSATGNLKDTETLEDLEVGAYGLFLSSACVAMILFNFYWFHRNQTRIDPED